MSFIKSTIDEGDYRRHTKPRMWEVFVGRTHRDDRTNAIIYSWVYLDNKGIKSRSYRTKDAAKQAVKEHKLRLLLER